MKRAIVFGATGGIGSEICNELAEAGWSVYVHYRHQDKLAQAICSELMAKYPMQDFIPIKLDFDVDDSELEKFVANLLPVNAVIFSQGITKYGFLGEQKLDDISNILNINLTVPIKLTKIFEKKLITQEFSRIIYLGSVYGEQGSPLEAVYSATKAGLSRFCQAYAREVASTNLTVNVIAPGAVDTKMNAIFSAETLQDLKSEIPTGRLATGKDIAFWVKNILQPESRYFTGQTIYVDGGWLI